MLKNKKNEDKVSHKNIYTETIYEILRNITLHTNDIDKNGLLNDSFFKREDIAEGKMRQLINLTNTLKKDIS